MRWNGVGWRSDVSGPGGGTTVVVAGVARRHGTRRVRCCNMRDALSHFALLRYEFPVLLSAAMGVLWKSSIPSRCGSKAFLHAVPATLSRPSPLFPTCITQKSPLPPSTPHKIRCAGYDLSLKPVWRVDQIYPGALGLPVIKHPHTLYPPFHLSREEAPPPLSPAPFK